MNNLIYLLFISVLLHCVNSRDLNEEFIEKLINKCNESKSRLSCFADKAARVLENSINWDIPLFDGVQFKRNSFDIGIVQQSRNSQSSFSRFTTALLNFLKTHTVSIDLTDNQDDEKPRSGDSGYSGSSGSGISGIGTTGGGDGGLGLGGTDKKALKKEKKYMQYAFMVLLGIFGLTGPLIMKTLAIMAAKALIASKAALIILGSVALKKLFEKDHEKPQVKVHTIHADDEYDDGHDRIYNNNKISPYYWTYDTHVKQS